MADIKQQEITPAVDHFQRYYAEKIWEWIPPIYRHEDGLDSNPNPHVLRAIVEVIAAQAAISRRSIDRLWEDQFIDLCDDWAVPYLADLVGTRLLSSLNRRGRRVDVAKTIFYRRRIGTPVVMEALIQDITGWEGKVVESFRRLGRTRHRLDCEPGPLAGPVTGTPPGGTADLRAVRGGDVIDGPFDDFSHTPDFRRHRGWKGHYNIPKLNFHLYRLQAYEVNFATPVHFADQQYVFDPSGRDIPLFSPDQRLNQAEWKPLEEWQLPAPIPCRLLNQERENLITEAIAILIGGAMSDPPFQSDQILGGNLLDWDIVSPNAAVEVIVDPHRGRFDLVNDPGPDDKVYAPRYYYGFSGEIGAGTYSRLQSRELVIDSVFDSGGDDPGPISVVEIPSNDVHEFSNSKTYVPDSPANDVIDGIDNLHLRAKSGKRPYLSLIPDEWVFKSQGDGAKCLILDGLWIGFDPDSTFPVDASPTRRVLALEGDFETVVIRNCTLDPGGVRADGRAIPYIELEIRGQVTNLIIESSITGPIRESTGSEDPCSVGEITITDSIVQSIEAGRPAIETRIGEVRLTRVTVFGDVVVNRLQASETLVQGDVLITNAQNSCVRFSAATSFGAAHFESHTYASGLPGRFFTSRRFGDPGYAQLSQGAPEEIYRGAENRSEMGAFSSLLNPIKRDDLEAKVLEYMPFGLIPQFIFET